MQHKQGWIKIHRQLLEWEWYDDINVKVLFFHLLLKANHKPKNYKGKITALNKLKSTNEITIKTSPQGTVIQIVNYKKYQIVTNEITNEQPTSNQQVTTNKNVKNDNNINKRKAEFKKLLAKYKDVYVLEMIKDFFEYWTEHGVNDKKMRFEKQTSFDVGRLKTWQKRSKNTYSGKNYIPPTYGN